MKKLTPAEKTYFQNKYIDRYVSQRQKENWKNYRSEKNFDIKEKEFKFLKKRKVYIPAKSENNLNLQESRGIGIKENETIDSVLENIYNMMSEDLRDYEMIRIDEINHLIEQNSLPFEGKNFLEIGFRVPKVQSYFEKKHKMNGYGIDINNFNCELFSILGYKVNCSNLNNENEIFFDNKKFDLVYCYHVLEHTHDPEAAIKNIYDNMTEKSVLQIEIPIEGDNQQLSYGHLIGFHPGELGELLKHTGFKIVYGTNRTHTGGSHIERYFATKGY